MRCRYRLAIFGLSCLGSVLAAAPAAADFRREQKLALAPGGQLLVDAAGGSVTVTGGATDGATVVITSTRADIEDRYSFELTSEPGQDYEMGADKHPGEHVLQLPPAVLTELVDVVAAAGDDPVRIERDHFIVFPV